ncbi:SMC-Scp complex subunit ScpB [Winogradskya consettensis]|uniref:SMC-Scp complex subunit ScpB n=1 Tax=Winogradskya consettensis TaxID=113560 RepID=UPI001FD61518|nr:SMC-Scp complex subunit ScpB [Actinoplanes consettensis]
MFDRAADDDVADDADVDLPFEEDVPAADDEPDSAESDDQPEPSDDAAEPESGAAGDEPELGLAAAGGGDEPGSRAVAVDAGAVGGAEIVAAGAAGAADVAAGLGGGAAAPVSGVPASGVPAQGRRRKRGEKTGAAVAVVEESARTLEELELKPLDEGELRAALEAILLVVDEPVAEMQLAQIIEQPTERVAAALEDISARYTAAGHGFDLRRAAGGWRLYTRPEYAPYVERFVLDGQSTRLTQAALETLAVVAYKQPVTRSRISAIRGVNCDGVMRTLVTRGLIEECGTEVETGAFLYRTTALFLEKLGLNSVDQLPPLAPFLPDDVEEVLDASG